MYCNRHCKNFKIGHHVANMDKKVNNKNVNCLKHPVSWALSCWKANFPEVSDVWQLGKEHLVTSADLRRRLCFWCGLFVCLSVSLFVCLFVCLSVGLLANLWTDFDEIFWRGRAWLKDQVIQFWWRSRSGFGSGSPKSEFRILRIGGGLYSLSISSYNNRIISVTDLDLGGTNEPQAGIFSSTFYARQHICYSAYMPWQFRLSVCHTSGSVKNGWS